MLSLVVSTVAFFVASHYLKRWADNNDFPKGTSLSISIFVAAVAISYGVAWFIDAVVAHFA
jgi:hypothetical protein